MVHAREKVAPVVEHRIAREAAALRQAFLRQGVEVVLGAAVPGSCNAVGDDPVQFLGLKEIAGADAGFYVSHRMTALKCCKSPCQGGVGVAVHEYDLRLRIFEHLVNALDSGCRLERVITAPDTEVVVRSRDPEFFEEYPAQFVIVVLARVKDGLLDSGFSCTVPILYRPAD